MELELRKLRKKLRAIDRLETHSNLTVDEQNKLTLRPQIQARVAEILSEVQFHEPEKSVSSNNNLSNDDLGSGDAELDKKRKSVEVSAGNGQMKTSFEALNCFLFKTERIMLGETTYTFKVPDPLLVSVVLGEVRRNLVI